MATSLVVAVGIAVVVTLGLVVWVLDGAARASEVPPSSVSASGR